MVDPEPRRPTAGMALLMLLILGLVLAGLLIWAYVRTNPSRPTPAGTANPKVLPATSSGGARPLH